MKKTPCTCTLCGHKWTPKGLTVPVSCPRCKRYDYAGPRVAAKQTNKGNPALDAWAGVKGGDK